MDVRHGAVLDARHTGALVLGESHVGRVLDLCATDPVGTVLAASDLLPERRASVPASSSAGPSPVLSARAAW